MTSPSDPRGEAGALHALYSNYFQVGFNVFEFLLDFGQSFANPESARVFFTRIMVTPGGAKNLSQTLRESVARYEETYGPIATED